MARLGIYVKDEELFKSLQADIKAAWYKKFGESLTYGDIMIKALENLKNSIEKDNPKSETKKQHIRQYCRTGFFR